MIEKYKHINTNPWQFNDSYPAGKEFDVKLSDNSILCKCECVGRGQTIWWESPVGAEFYICVDLYPSAILGWRLSV